jgi:hypothetical protein
VNASPLTPSHRRRRLQASLVAWHDLGDAAAREQAATNNRAWSPLALLLDCAAEHTTPARSGGPNGSSD